jgi:hypothetical protein
MRGDVMTRNDAVLSTLFFLSSSILIFLLKTGKIFLDALLSQIIAFLLILAVSFFLPEKQERQPVKPNIRLFLPLLGVFALSAATGIVAGMRSSILLPNAGTIIPAFMGLSAFLSQFFGVFLFSVLEWLLCIFFSEDIKYADLLKVNSIIYMIYVIPLIIDWSTLPVQASLMSDPKSFRAYTESLLKLGKVVENLVISLYYVGLRLITSLSLPKAIVSSILPNLAVGLSITLLLPL